MSSRPQVVTSVFKLGRNLLRNWFDVIDLRRPISAWPASSSYHECPAGVGFLKSFTARGRLATSIAHSLAAVFFLI